MNLVNPSDPARLPVRSAMPAPSDWQLRMEPVPTPGPGEFVVAVSYLSIDPAMRRWIDTAFREPVMFTGENTDKLVLAVP